MTTTIEILFIHHSVGRGILRHGAVRKHLSTMGGDVVVSLWDHDYNRRGLHDPTGRRLRRSFPIPNDDTDPKGLATLFDMAARNRALGDQLSRFPVIVVKSCFPNSRIKSSDDYLQLQQLYSTIAQGIRALGSIPCIMTTPPVRFGRIAPGEARRAAEMARWLVSDGPFNFTFDLFTLLAETDSSSAAYGTLARENANIVPIDSHPKIRASRRIGPFFASFLNHVAVTVSSQQSTRLGS